ncbi:hypothetical protein HAX54_047065 [Datura stramonium]|uniref:Uncharacterized protein n=1 Tax=Datura stramonium TaxID=4076 RepID=A0ABS8SSA9_DATST|nr:hypothetical protein [Datura stramonium]
MKNELKTSSGIYIYRHLLTSPREARLITSSCPLVELAPRQAMTLLWALLCEPLPVQVAISSLNSDVTYTTLLPDITSTGNIKHKLNSQNIDILSQTLRTCGGLQSDSSSHKILGFGANEVYNFSCSSPVHASMSSWCGWHTDHGSLTGLTCGMFTRDAAEILCPDSAAGLYIKTRNGQIVKPIQYNTKYPCEDQEVILI